MRPVRRDLALGPEVIRLLLPNRRPLVLVDTLTGFAVEPEPTLLARKLVSTSEPVFDGHFEDLALWPGVYTIEGLAQTAMLLFRLLDLARQDPEGVLRDLKELSALQKLQPGPGASRALALRERLRAMPAFGVLSAVDVKLTAPVFAGDVLDLRAGLGPGYGGSHRVEVEAGVGRRTVTKGTLTVALRPVPGGARLSQDSD